MCTAIPHVPRGSVGMWNYGSVDVSAHLHQVRSLPCTCREHDFDSDHLWPQVKLNPFHLLLIHVIPALTARTYLISRICLKPKGWKSLRNKVLFPLRDGTVKSPDRFSAGCSYLNAEDQAWEWYSAFDRQSFTNIYIEPWNQSSQW